MHDGESISITSRVWWSNSPAGQRPPSTNSRQIRCLPTCCRAPPGSAEPWATGELNRAAAPHWPTRMAGPGTQWHGPPGPPQTWRSLHQPRSQHDPAPVGSRGRSGCLLHTNCSRVPSWSARSPSLASTCWQWAKPPLGSAAAPRSKPSQVGRTCWSLGVADLEPQ